MVRNCDCYLIICVFKKRLSLDIDRFYIGENYNLGICVGML